MDSKTEEEKVPEISKSDPCYFAYMAGYWEAKYRAAINDLDWYRENTAASYIDSLTKKNKRHGGIIRTVLTPPNRLKPNSCVSF